MKNPSEQLKADWHQNPLNWKWGMFYYNKEDERFFPPKRHKQLGWTVNFAYPFAYFFVLGIPLISILFVLLLK